MTSTYTLKVNEIKSNHYSILDDSYTERFNIEAGELQLFLYNAPPLDFENEDIFVTFIMTPIHGTTPYMAGKFCEKRDANECLKNLKNSDVLHGRKNLQSSINQNGVYELTIDHDEENCKIYFDNNCTYVIAVSNSDSTSSSAYQLYASHS